MLSHEKETYDIGSFEGSDPTGKKILPTEHTEYTEIPPVSGKLSPLLKFI